MAILPFTSIPVLGVIAYGSNMGKTTLLKKIIPLLKKRGIRPAVIKHVHCGFDLDTPGKDSFEFRKTGADQVLVASGERWALMTEEQQENNYPDLAKMVSHINSQSAEIILVEGFKEAAHPKIEIHRQAIHTPCLYPNDQTIIAVASDNPQDLATDLPLLNLNNPTQITDFITNWLNKQ